MLKYKECTFDNISFNREHTSRVTYTRCIFQSVDFSSLNLDIVRFIECVFNKPVFNNTQLTDVDFYDSVIINPSFVDAKLTRTVFTNSNLMRAEFTDTTIQSNIFSLTKLVSARLKNVQLIGTQFNDSCLPYLISVCTTFVSCEITFTNMHNAHITAGDLTGCRLSDIDMRGATIKNVKFEKTTFDLMHWYAASIVNPVFDNCNIKRIDFDGADIVNPVLVNTELSSLSYVPKEGEFIAYKVVKALKGNEKVVLTLKIPSDSPRTSTLLGRKCRAAFVEVLEGSGNSFYDANVIYRPGELVYAHEYDPSPLVECAPGIHFFMTREEAENYVY